MTETPLTQAQVDQFRTRGYVFIPDFWGEREVAAMQAEVQRLRDAGLLHNVATDGDGTTTSATRANLQIIPIFPHSKLFRSLPFHPKAVAAARQLLGDPLILEEDQIFLKPARHGAGTNWHTDNAYFKIDDPLAGTSMWNAIHDATVENGTLRVIPDAFAKDWAHSRDPESDHHIRCYPPEDHAEYALLRAGGVAYFCYGTPHATGGNQTDGDRAAAAYHYLNGAHAPEFLTAPDRTKWPWISGPDADEGRTPYGVSSGPDAFEEAVRELVGS